MILNYNINPKKLFNETCTLLRLVLIPFLPFYSSMLFHIHQPVGSTFVLNLLVLNQVLDLHFGEANKCEFVCMPVVNFDMAPYTFSGVKFTMKLWYEVHEMATINEIMLNNYLFCLKVFLVQKNDLQC